MHLSPLGFISFLTQALFCTSIGSAEEFSLPPNHYFMINARLTNATTKQTMQSKFPLPIVLYIYKGTKAKTSKRTHVPRLSIAIFLLLGTCNIENQTIIDEEKQIEAEHADNHKKNSGRMIKV